MVTIKFTDGSTITAEQNGTCYIVPEKPDFPTDLSEVVVDGEYSQTYHNAEVIECASVDGRYWFGFREIPQEEIDREKMDAQILFTAVVTDTLLEDE